VAEGEQRPDLTINDAAASMNAAASSMGAAAASLSRRVALARKFASQYAPWISLALGVGARILSKHDIHFAPKAVALLLLAWTFPAIVARVLPEPAAGAVEPGWRRALRTTGAPFFVVILYKNVLFFLVPIWFGAAHFPSLNMGAPLLLAAMALATCFSGFYQREIIAHPVRRVLWSAVVLFAALVPATAVLAFTSPRVSLFLAALLSTAVATAALKGGGESILSRRAITGLLVGALPVAALVVFAAPLLPPVPADCLDKGAGTAIVDRGLEGRADSFPHGTKRVYAWFAVSLPARYRQQILFQWFHDGAAVGGPVATTIEGGRAGGWRTATSRNAPAPGRWRADVLNEIGQLIGRVKFDVTP
jgi:hypothetical protein